MKKKFMQFALLLLAAALLLPAGAGAAGAPMNANVRIGITYGSSAVPGANLLNEVGSGYRLGYFDADLNFVQLGWTAETGVSIVKTQNVWYGPLPGSTLKGYSDAITSDVAVGCYHIQLPTAYASFDEALAAAGTVPSGFPAWVDGAYYVRAGAYLSAEEANAAMAGMEGATLAGTSSYAVSVVKTGTGTILFQFDGGAALSLGVKPGLDDGVKTVTWYALNKYYGAFRYQRLSGGNLTVVSIVDREDYINCVISREMSSGWPLEALKAQAVSARSYAANKAGRHTADGFDLCATTHCQVYYGCGSVAADTAQAAAETAGEYIWYNGDVVETYYFSSDGGATESAKNVWGGDTPYAVGVADPWEAAVADKISAYNWTVTYTKAELEEKLRSSGRNCRELVAFQVSEFTPTGNVRAITFTDNTGKSWTISGGENCKFFLGLNSVRYTVSGGGGSYYVNEDGGVLGSVNGAYAVDGDGNKAQVSGTPYVITAAGTEELAPAGTTGDTFTITGSGNGHNVGMSQWGAYAMAKAGKTYREILNFYYTGIEIKQ